MNNQRGFTYIELLIYIVILSMIMTASVQLVWNIFYSQTKSDTMQEYNQNMRYLTQRLSYEIRNATGVNTAVGSSLSLSSSDSARNPTIFTLTSGRVYLGYGSSGSCPTSSPCPLTSNRIQITGLSFTNLSSGDGKSVNVQYDIGASNTSSNVRSEYKYSGTYHGSTEIRLK